MSDRDIQPHVLASLEESRLVLQAFLAQPENAGVISGMARALADCFAAGNKVLACGNGGSACDAAHLAEEFTGRFRDDRAPLPAIALTDGAHLTCVANDYGFDEVFARGVKAYGKSGDVLIALSTSGNSRNVLRAVEAARSLGMAVFLLLGKTGGALRGSGDHELWVRSETTERIQEIHMLALHVVIECVERILFPDNYGGSPQRP
jgi:D-sedoheptulose 7-phosphate isomerase